ncbi:hypothetical protein K7Z75_24505 [Mycobacterium avium subsp. hominissuis]|uniref:hypothetical protein n=1 Tax=Mycobacterium avium TaxID=1764 RepID=UPI00293A73A8|nr:hypothetical protein [Mycobacterium avium]MDV3306788.1 hypothetical protein [Mycobacterium avium subsp. hominissuis]
MIEVTLETTTRYIRAYDREDVITLLGEADGALSRGEYDTMSDAALAQALHDVLDGYDLDVNEHVIADMGTSDDARDEWTVEAR